MPDKKKKTKVGSMIFRIVLIIIAGLTVGLGVFSWNASRVVGNQLPMPFGFGVSVVMSPSMEPVLKTNDLIFVSEDENYEVGDIVVYQDGNMLVIHRIINIDGENVITKGDANNIADDPIKLNDIKAKFSFRIPFIGVIFKYLKTVPGTLLVLVLAIFLLYRSRQKEREKDRDDLESIVEEIKRLRAQQENNGSAEDKTEDKIEEADTSTQSTEESNDDVDVKESSDFAEKAENTDDNSGSTESIDAEGNKTSHETADSSTDTSSSAVYEEGQDISED
ncbi:MAG: signal peptidase I [Ruminococcus sp.]|nr:signal peptidase I [Ruminococcus sp.]